MGRGLLPVDEIYGSKNSISPVVFRNVLKQFKQGLDRDRRFG
jgi:hypothetical protein